MAARHGEPTPHRNAETDKARGCGPCGGVAQGVAGEADGYTSASVGQPSPVPQLYTVSASSTLPAGIDSVAARRA
jgi:hypothetical protein